MGLNTATDARDLDGVASEASKEKKYAARRKIEDWAEFKRLKSEHGWMDDFKADFADVY